MSQIITRANLTPLDHIKPGMRTTIGGNRLTVLGWGGGQKLVLKGKEQIVWLPKFVLAELVARDLAFYGKEAI